jgi:methyltransferase-like protein
MKFKEKIILTTQMFNAFCHFKAQSKSVLDVTNLQLAPTMTNIFYIHTLQLFEMSQWMTNMKKLK